MHAAIENLLTHCADIKSDESVLIVQEDPALGWYEQSIWDALTQGLTELGIAAQTIRVGDPGNAIETSLSEQIANHDCTIYLARIGDQNRFDIAPPGTRSVMCYARDSQMLNSAFCTTDYRAFKALKQAIDQVFGQASRVQINCAMGTNLSGDMPNGRHQGQDDVSVLRFPLGVPTPVLADTFSGQVALAHYLTPTGNRVYEPAWVALPEKSIAQIDSGAITDFTGSPQTVQRIQNHYQQVSTRFGIEPMFVHSWHAGMHPGCAYTGCAAQNPDRWSNTMFCNPHFVHFHTCGQYAPGEICWMVRDPTIRLDGVALWEDGRLNLDRFDSTDQCATKWPQLRELANIGPVSLGLN